MGPSGFIRENCPLATTNNDGLMSKEQATKLSDTVTLTDAASITTDATRGSVFSVTLGGNRTLANPTGLTDGGTYLWMIKQDGTGGRTLAYGNKFTWPGGAAPTITATASAVDVISAVYDGAADKLRAAIQQDFS